MGRDRKTEFALYVLLRLGLPIDVDIDLLTVPSTPRPAVVDTRDKGTEHVLPIFQDMICIHPGAFEGILEDAQADNDVFEWHPEHVRSRT